MPDSAKEPLPIVQPLDIKDEARPHSKTGGDIEWPVMPPAEESIQLCLDLGLIVPNGSYEYKEPGKPVVTVPAYAAGPNSIKRQRVHWGDCEMRLLVKTLWPDIPDKGVPFDDVLDLARRAVAALRDIQAHPAHSCEPPPSLV